MLQATDVFHGKPQNKNKLEKKTIVHDTELGDEIEKAGDKIGDGLKKMGDKLKEATGQ